MAKNLFILLALLFIFSKSSNVKKYNVEQEGWNDIIIELNETTACVCFNLEEVKRNKYFHIKANCDDKNSKIDKTLYYNYLDSCDSNTTCDDIYLNNYSENNNRTIEIESITGFVHEYKFNKENKNAILIQYKNFKGETFRLQLTSYNSRILYIIILSVFVGAFALANVCLSVSIYKRQKKINNLLDF